MTNINVRIWIIVMYVYYKMDMFHVRMEKTMEDTKPINYWRHPLSLSWGQEPHLAFSLTNLTVQYHFHYLHSLVYEE